MGSPRASTIQLNGKVYDLLSGKPVVPSEPKHAIKPVPKKPAVSSGQVMDGVAKHKSGAAHHVAPVARKKVQRSKTLMRRAVKKPAATSHAAKNVITKPAKIDPIRLNRASHVPKSQLISRFGSAHDRSFAPHIAPLPVKPEPDTSEPPLTLQHHTPAVRLPARHSHGHASHSIERALHKAESHKQPKLKKPSISHRAAHRLHVSPRAVRISSGFAAALLLAGFFVYQNMPRLAMRVAAARAGIHASMPGYQPSGFALKGSIRYSPGQIQMSYKSNSDDRSYQLTQKATNLTPETLADEQVASKDQPYQTVEEKGKTILIDDQNKAIWVNNGILYELNGKALSSDQLLRIAGSM